jgi:hypothetical protein
MSIPLPQPHSLARPAQALDAVIVAAWAALLVGVLVVSWLLFQPDPGEALTRNTARLALLGYGPAVALILSMRRPESLARSGRGRLARWFWTLGLAGYLVHLVVAFHYYHQWSHVRAMQHVEEASGFGPGIFCSHLFTLLWAADVLWWWLRPAGYARRPAWIGGSLHGYLAFITFNGTVVYESGLIRWVGVILFSILGGLLLWRWRSERKERVA